VTEPLVTRQIFNTTESLQAQQLAANSSSWLEENQTTVAIVAFGSIAVLLIVALATTHSQAQRKSMCLIEKF